MSREIKVSAWAVVWTDKGAEEYGVTSKDRLVTVDPKEEKVVVVFGKGDTFGEVVTLSESVAVFQERKEANAFWEGNSDWDVVPCTINYTLGLTSPSKGSKGRRKGG